VRTFIYPARFEGQPCIAVTFRDVGEAAAHGRNEKDALRQAADRLEAAIAARIARGMEIPAASRPEPGERLVPVPASMAAKAALYIAMREARLTNVALARKLGCDEKEVRRMLDPNHATKLPRIKEALDALGKRLVLSVEDAAQSLVPAASRLFSTQSET